MTPLLKPAKKNNLAIADDWVGETVVCIGGGPSLLQADVLSLVGKARIIVVNDAYKLAPFADVLYACDLKWWQWHQGCRYFLGEKWTQDKEAARQFHLNYIEGIAGPGINTYPHLINHGSNSGHQAINFAYHKGASRIILLGYDMKPAIDGKQHWFGNHPDKIHSDRRAWLPHFKVIADQGLIEIINCSRDTALNCFPRLPLEAILWT